MSILLVVLLSGYTPQTTDLSGKWAVEVEAASMRTDDGGSRSRSALEIELELQTKGTTASAQFASVRGETIRLTGTWKDGRLDLTSEWREIDITNNGRPAKAKARWVIRGGLKDAVLGGTWDFQMGDSSLPQRWTAKRAMASRLGQKPSSSAPAIGQSQWLGRWTCPVSIVASVTGFHGPPAFHRVCARQPPRHGL